MFRMNYNFIDASVLFGGFPTWKAAPLLMLTWCVTDAASASFLIFTRSHVEYHFTGLLRSCVVAFPSSASSLLLCFQWFGSLVLQTYLRIMLRIGVSLQQLRLAKFPSHTTLRREAEMDFWW